MRCQIVFKTNDEESLWPSLCLVFLYMNSTPINTCVLMKWFLWLDDKLESLILGADLAEKVMSSGCF